MTIRQKVQYGVPLDPVEVLAEVSCQHHPHISPQAYRILLAAQMHLNGGTREQREAYHTVDTVKAWWPEP